MRDYFLKQQIFCMAYVRGRTALLHPTIDRCLTLAKKNTSSAESLTLCYYDKMSDTL